MDGAFKDGNDVGADAEDEGSIGARLGGTLNAGLSGGLSSGLRKGLDSQWGGRQYDIVRRKEGVQNSINVRANHNSGTVNINLKSQGRGGVIGNRNVQSGNGVAQPKLPLHYPLNGYSGSNDDVDSEGDLYGGINVGAGLRGIRRAGGHTWAVDPAASATEPSEDAKSEPKPRDREADTTKSTGPAPVVASADDSSSFLDDGDGDTDARIQLQGGARLSDGTRLTRLPRNTRNVLINPIYVQSRPHIDANTAVQVRNHLNSGGGRSGRWRDDLDDDDRDDRGNADVNVGGGVHGNGGGGLSGVLGGGGARNLLAPVSGVLGTVGSGLLRGGGGGLVGNLGNGLLGGPGGGLLGRGGGVRGLLGGDTPDGRSGVGTRRRRRSRQRRGEAPEDKGVVGTLLNDLLKGTT